MVLVPYDAKQTDVDTAEPPRTRWRAAARSPTAPAAASRPSCSRRARRRRWRCPTAGARPIQDFDVRVTEYTQGDSGLAAMPGQLPPNTAYTYAAEFSVDEAVEDGATDVRFDKPVISYTDNFLDLPVGGAVPAGYYDREREEWVGSKNGLVIGIVGETGLAADVDIDGDGEADTAQELAAIGMDDRRARALAGLYDARRRPSGAWRSALHAVGLQLALRPRPRRGRPQRARPRRWRPRPQPALRQAGSIVFCDSQVLGEELPLTGVGHEALLPLRPRPRPHRRAHASTSRSPRPRCRPAPTSWPLELEIDIAGRDDHQRSSRAPARTSSTASPGTARTPTAARSRAPRPPRCASATATRPSTRRRASFPSSWASVSGNSITGNRARQDFTRLARARGSAGHATTSPASAWAAGRSTPTTPMTPGPAPAARRRRAALRRPLQVTVLEPSPAPATAASTATAARRSRPALDAPHGGRPRRRRLRLRRRHRQRAHPPRRPPTGRSTRSPATAPTASPATAARRPRRLAGQPARPGGRRRTARSTSPTPAPTASAASRPAGRSARSPAAATRPRHRRRRPGDGRAACQSPRGRGRARRQPSTSPTRSTTACAWSAPRATITHGRGRRRRRLLRRRRAGRRSAAARPARRRDRRATATSSSPTPATVACARSGPTAASTRSRAAAHPRRHGDGGAAPRRADRATAGRGSHPRRPHARHRRRRRAPAPHRAGRHHPHRRRGRRREPRQTRAPGHRAALLDPRGVAVAPTGDVYIAETRRATWSTGAAQLLRGYADGDLLDRLRGRHAHLPVHRERAPPAHARRADGRRRSTQFAYDAPGRLAVPVSDREGALLTIDRERRWAPTALVARGGQRTALALDARLPHHGHQPGGRGGDLDLRRGRACSPASTEPGGDDCTPSATTATGA